MALMGYREYARHSGVSLRAVQKAIEVGHFKVTPEKKIDSVQADRDWDRNKDASRSAVSIVDTKPQRQASLLTGPPPEDDQPDDEVVATNDQTTKDYRTARAQREQYQALKQKHEYEQLVGQLISVEEAKRIAYTTFRAIRDSIMNIPTRLKDQLAAQTDAHVCEKLLDAELAAALSGIDVGKLLTDSDE